MLVVQTHVGHWKCRGRRGGMTYSSFRGEKQFSTRKADRLSNCDGLLLLVLAEPLTSDYVAETSDHALTCSSGFLHRTSRFVNLTLSAVSCFGWSYRGMVTPELCCVVGPDVAQSWCTCFVQYLSRTRLPMLKAAYRPRGLEK